MKILPNDLEHLDPGIVDVVKALRDAGFTTTDSGDGESKHNGYWTDQGYEPVEGALTFPHVVVFITDQEQRARKHSVTVRSRLPDGWDVEVERSAQHCGLIVFCSKH